MIIETRTFDKGEVKQLILVPENESESEKIDYIGKHVPVAVKGEITLSDGYATHYIRLVPMTVDNIKTINQWAHYINLWAERKGWNENLILGNQVANFHTEISEAWEEIRNGHQITEVYESEGGKPEGFGIELADLIIRVLHTAGHYGLNIEELISRKMAYNETRSYRHGNKTS